MLDDARATIEQRLGLRARAVVDRQVAAVLQQPRGKHLAHPANPDPSEGLRIWRVLGHVLTLSGWRSCANDCLSIAAPFLRCQRAGYSALTRGRAPRWELAAPTTVDSRTMRSGVKRTRRRVGSSLSI